MDEETPDETNNAGNETYNEQAPSSTAEEVPEQGSRAWIWITLVLVVLIAIGIGIYLFADYGKILGNEEEAGEEEIISQTDILETSEFPETISDYVLESAEAGQEECTNYEPGMTDVEGNEINVSGEVCSSGTFLTYFNNLNKKTIFVTLGNFSKGKDTFQEVTRAMFPELSPVPGTSVYSLEIHELLWFTSQGSEYEQVFILESDRTSNEDGSVSYDYSDSADINNPVTQHFLNEYPAVSW